MVWSVSGIHEPLARVVVRRDPAKRNESSEATETSAERRTSNRRARRPYHLPVTTHHDYLGPHVAVHAACVAGPFRITHKSYSSAFSQGWHEHPEASIDFVLCGGGAGVYAGEEVVSRAGTVEYFGAGVRHSFRSAGSGIRTLHVVMPADLPRELGVDADTLVRELDASLAAGPALALAREAGAAGADPLLVESLAMRLLEEVAGAAGARDDGAWLAQVREALLEEPEQAGSLAELAAACGRHPSHLARQFRAAYGVTVGEFGRRVRLARAARRLAERHGPPLAAVALEQGFADQAHFSRAFRAAYGCTPREFRARLAG